MVNNIQIYFLRLGLFSLNYWDKRSHSDVNVWDKEEWEWIMEKAPNFMHCVFHLTNLGQLNIENKGEQGMQSEYKKARMFSKF